MLAGAYKRAQRKILFINAVTAVLLGATALSAAVDLTDYIWVILTLPLAALFYLVAFEDLGEWFRHRQDVWTLTPKKLHLDNPGEEPSWIDLKDIASVQTWMFWSLRIGLKSGVKITEVPSFESERLFGTSHLNTVTDGWRVLKTIVAERRDPFVPSANVIDLRDRSEI